MNSKMIEKYFFRPANFFLVMGIIFVMMSVKNAIPNVKKGINRHHPASTVYEKSDSLSKTSGLDAGNVNVIVVGENNIKWFVTDAGILSFDGTDWKLHDEINIIPIRETKGMAYAFNTNGPELWIASPGGATVIRRPMDDEAERMTFNADNSDIFGGEVVDIATGKDSICWFGTEKGISALNGGQWLARDYDIHYPEEMFQEWPITRLATNPEGDSLYAATAGAGIARVYRDDVDAISGASVYAQWGPIILPSDYVYSLYIAPDGVQWFGTDAGIARHSGYNTLENWTVYTTEDGMADNFVQAICGDGKGNIWIGTRGGISVFNGSTWISYTTDNGLASNHILSIAIDQEGVVWIGSDTGISRFEDGLFTNY